MKQIVMGILAHVDAGKTTLSEGLLYAGGSIRKIGRVDNKDAFLDTYELERQRGITIFSKQAQIDLKDCKIALLDTPGHIDFSAEMERTLQVLDYAILVISGADGVQGHTQTLWRLLEEYNIPVFIFVNKMDQQGTDKNKLMNELRNRLGSCCVDFLDDNMAEEAASCDEEAMEEFFENNDLSEDTIAELIAERKVYPVWFGSALKNTGVKEFLELIYKYTLERDYDINFGARVFKIARDDSGNRLTFVKVTGGGLKTKDVINFEGSSTIEGWSEKVNQIRIYSGEKYSVVNEAESGTICALTGLTQTFPGQGLGIESDVVMPFLEPVLSYQIILPQECDAAVVLPKLKQIEEEEPQLHIEWNEETQKINVCVMGEVQIQILKSMIKERFGIDVEFDTGNIVYKETIRNTVEGVGHFEPLRHYAEVHLLLEPLERGAGLEIAIDCSEEVLDKNWQRLIFTHLYEKQHRGVLTGSQITDLRITLKSGRAHQKHTEGGDFRQATYRAVRQGLMTAESVLLEPFYEFRLEIPENMVGRAMSDIERMHGKFEISQEDTALVDSEGKKLSILTGSAPVKMMKDYPKQVIAYTKGHGRIFCNLCGYRECENADEVIQMIGYEAQRDIENTPDSVFCSHGSGYTVKWDEVYKHMHLESILNVDKTDNSDANGGQSEKKYKSIMDEWIGTEEIDEILRQTYCANKRGHSSKAKCGWKRRSGTNISDRRNIKNSSSYTKNYNLNSLGVNSSEIKQYDEKRNAKEYLLVDGYNIIFAWEELNELAKINIDGARGRLLDIMCNYQGMRKCELIVVFDAYRVKGHDTEILDYHNIHVVYTKEAETADAYIEKFAHEHGRKEKVTVATSDGLEQVIIRGQGCFLISAREFEQEVKAKEKELRENFLEKQPKDKVIIGDMIDNELKQKIEKNVTKKD